MAKTGRIQYLHDETTHAELILCEQSSISYQCQLLSLSFLICEMGITATSMELF